MKKGLLLGAAALAIVFASCSNDEMSESTSNSSAQRALSFSTYSEKTRAGVDTLTDANLTAFRVMGYYTGTNNIDAEHFIPNYMYNQDVVRANVNKDWKYNPTKYWPQVGDKLSFFAISGDEDDENINWTNSNSALGLPVFQLKALNGLTEDCVAATSVNNVAKATGANDAISMTFKHVTSRLKVQAKVSDGINVGSKVTITKLQLKKRDGSSNIYSSIAKSSIDENGICKIIPNNNLDSISLDNYLTGNEMTVGDDMADVFGNGYAFLIPVGVTGTEAAGDAVLEVKYKLTQPDQNLTGEISLINKVATYDIPANFLAQGKAYCLDMIIDGGDKVTFKTNIESWNTDDQEKVAGATMLWYRSVNRAIAGNDFLTDPIADPIGFGRLNDVANNYSLSGSGSYVKFLDNSLILGYNQYDSNKNNPVITINPAQFPCIKAGAKLVIYSNADLIAHYSSLEGVTAKIGTVPTDKLDYNNIQQLGLDKQLKGVNIQEIQIPDDAIFTNKFLTLELVLHTSNWANIRIIGLGIIEPTSNNNNVQ